MKSLSRVGPTALQTRAVKLCVSTDRLGVLFFDVVLQFPLGRSSRSLLQPDSKLLPLFHRHHDACDDNEVHFTSPDNVRDV